MAVLDVSITDPAKGSLSNYSFNETKRIHDFEFPCSDRNNCISYEVTLKEGFYKFECWGASGGDGSEPGGHGAYVSGTILLPTRKKLYLFIGGKGESDTVNTFNGGGAAGIRYGKQGGGATDIRTVNNQQFEGLKSRIMVAAGGGGATQHVLATTSGNGGAINGTIGHDNINNLCAIPIVPLKVQIPATQTHAGISDDGKEGEFGIGGSGYIGEGGGGGGGYYGGSMGLRASCIVATGGGGSSFISGHKGCKSVKRSSSQDPIQHNNDSIHYTGLYFQNTLMQSGDEEFLSPYNQLETGHLGNGFIRITTYILNLSITCKTNMTIHINFITLQIFLLLLK